MGDSADNAPMKWTLIGAAALLIAGCSPALNWRTVPLPDPVVMNVAAAS